jgi:hypothetical protein
MACPAKADRGAVRLTALTTVKIEGDVLEEFVRHTLRFVDRLIVVDNGSLDAAREILGDLVSEGLPLTVWEGEAVPSSAGTRTLLARRAFAAFETDYLLAIDVDEFVRAASRAVLEEALANLDGAHALVPWVTYVPTPSDDAEEPRVLVRLRHRLRTEPRSYSKVFVHRSFAERAGSSLVPGNHAVLEAGAAAESRVLTGIELAHFPVRSLIQIQSKALIGWPKFLAMGFNETHGLAYQWLRLNELLLERADWDANDFYRIAWHYLDEDEKRPELVFDPLPRVELRYNRAQPELLALSIAFTRQLALAYAGRCAAPSAASV